MADQGDIRLLFDAAVGYGDLVVADRDLDRDDGFETAVTISLFTNRRADAEDLLPDEDGSRQGWWADRVDAGNPAPDFIGSKLWLLGRGKLTTDLPARAEEFAREALQWMIDDNVATTISVEAVRSGMFGLQITVHIVRPTNVNAISYRYFYNWKNQIARSQ